MASLPAGDMARAPGDTAASAAGPRRTALGLGFLSSIFIFFFLFKTKENVWGMGGGAAVLRADQACPTWRQRS